MTVPRCAAAVLAAVSLLCFPAALHADDADGSVSQIELTQRELTFHILNRLAFGPRPGQVAEVLKQGWMNWVLEQLEPESDVVLWDGGNNDTSFLRANLELCVADALRPGHERLYYPGETNFRRASVVVVNKVAQAEPGAVAVRNAHDSGPFRGVDHVGPVDPGVSLLPASAPPIVHDRGLHAELAFPAAASCAAMLAAICPNNCM